MLFKLPWIMHQTWSHTLFCTYEVPADMIRPLVGSKMELDTFNSKTYVSLIPLHMEKLHLRMFPVLPGTSGFPELNCRTYVRVKGEPGVSFFSIDAGSTISAWLARTFFRLPFLRSDMTFDSNPDGSFQLTCNRPRSDSFNPAEFKVSWKPKGKPHAIDPGTLDEFIANRSSMFVQLQSGIVLRGTIQHAPWLIQDVDARIEKNTVLRAAGIDLQGPPAHVACSSGIGVHCWPMLPVEI
ncbi:MAG: YqjF family protein [Bdellovibrionota bacterium]